MRYKLIKHLTWKGWLIWQWPSVNLPENHHVAILNTIGPQGTSGVFKRLVCICNLFSWKNPKMIINLFFYVYAFYFSVSPCIHITQPAFLHFQLQGRKKRFYFFKPVFKGRRFYTLEDWYIFGQALLFCQFILSYNLI